MEQQCYRLSAGAIAGNRDAEQILRDKGFRAPVALIPQFGVDPEIFSAERGDEDTTLPVPFGADKFVVGYGGGLLPEKGVDLLLRACARLGGDRWRLLLLGEGPERVALEGLAEELGIRDRVHFAGRVPSTATPAYYRRMNALVLPSLTRANWGEQFGRVLIEAMACGVPVVGSSSMEIPRVIGDAGLIFAEGDVPALCVALQRLLGDESLCRELVARGRRASSRTTPRHRSPPLPSRFYERLLHENP